MKSVVRSGMNSRCVCVPAMKPLPVELYSAYITGRVEVAAAITLCFLLFVIPATIALERLGGGGLGQA